MAGTGAAPATPHPAPPGGGGRKPIAESPPPQPQPPCADGHGVRRTFTLAEILPAAFRLEEGG